MIYKFAAQAILLVHLGFVAYAILGGFLVLRWPWTAVLHIPTVFWAVYVEVANKICPLTIWENEFRLKAGDDPLSSGGFLETYIFPILYPEGLTVEFHFWLGIAVGILNLLIYAWVGYRLFSN